MSDNTINDEFGDHELLDEDELNEPAFPLERRPVQPIELPEWKDQLQRVTRASEAGAKAFLAPTGKQAQNIEKLANPARVINTEGDPGSPTWAMVPNDATNRATELGPFTLVQGFVGNNLLVLKHRLLGVGWKTNTRIDQLQSPSGLIVEMGYALKEVWYRAYRPGVVTTARQPYSTGKMLTWDDDNVYAGSSEAFRHLDVLNDCAELADYTLRSVARTDNTLRALAEANAVEAQTSELEPLCFKKLTSTAKLPTRAHNDDAGFDLYCDLGSDPMIHQVIRPGEFVDVPCGVALGLPAGYWARLVGRSSTLRRRGLLVSEGIIDTGYTGPLFAGVWNLTNVPVRIEHGERLAQIIVHMNDSVGFEPTWDSKLKESDRGEKGFGSSGS